MFCTRFSPFPPSHSCVRHKSLALLFALELMEAETGKQNEKEKKKEYGLCVYL